MAASCGHVKGVSEKEFDAMGLLSQHAYSVLDVRVVAAGEVPGRREEEGPLRMVKLRNPWGHHEWTGEFSDKDLKNWTPELRRALGDEGRGSRDDGIFWMRMSDLARFFSTVTVCKTFDKRSRTQARTAHTIPAAANGNGEGTGQSVRDHMQPVFVVETFGRVDCAAWLAQKWERGRGAHDMSDLAFVLFEVDTKAVPAHSLPGGEKGGESSGAGSGDGLSPAAAARLVEWLGRSDETVAAALPSSKVIAVTKSEKTAGILWEGWLGGGGGSGERGGGGGGGGETSLQRKLYICVPLSFSYRDTTALGRKGAAMAVASERQQWANTIPGRPLRVGFALFATSQRPVIVERAAVAGAGWFYFLSSFSYPTLSSPIGSHHL